MDTKFNIGDEVFIKGEVKEIRIFENGVVHYIIKYLNQENVHSPFASYLEDNIYDIRTEGGKA